MFSVGGQFGELLANTLMVATLTLVCGHWAGWSSADMLVTTTGCCLFGAVASWKWGGAWRTATSPNALKPLARDGDGALVKEPDPHPIGAAQVELIERLAVIGLNPIVLRHLTDAIRRGKWYDSWEDLETYFSTDSFDTIVEEVRELGLDVNQAKSFVRRMQREFKRANTSKV